MKKAPLAIALSLASLLAVSSCSAVTPKEASSAPAASASSSAAPSESKNPTPEDNKVKAGDVINGLPTKSELADNGKGKYIQTTILDTDPAMKYTQAVDAPEVTQLFTPDEVAEAQKFAVRFIAEEAIDSTINDNYADAAVISAWWERNKEKIDPVYHTTVLQSLQNSEDMTLAIVQRANFRKYNLANGPEQVHVLSRKITPTAITAGVVEGKNYLGFSVNADFEMATDIPSGTSGMTKPESTTATLYLTMRIDESTGNWVISGFKNTFTTTPVA